MKTTVYMERDLHGVKVRQSTKDSFFNANDLLTLFEINGGKDKRIQSYFDLKGTQEYMSAIQADILNNSDSCELELPHVYYSKRGRYGGTWMHPFLFIDFAMWLSPEFKLTCVKWIYDNLIKFRVDSGDSFKEVNNALCMFTEKATRQTYRTEALMINSLVFGKAEGGKRNNANEEQLRKLSSLQKADVKLIQNGYNLHDRFRKLREIYQLI